MRKGYKMHRFFEANIKPTDQKTVLTNENFLHARALRLKFGEHVILCDGAENDYYCMVTSASKANVELKIICVQKNTSEPNIDVTLFQALPKGKKMNDIIENCVPLGVSAVVPIVTARCIANIDTNIDNKELTKIDRWRKTSEAAAKQSGRGIIPIIKQITKIEDAVGQAKNFGTTFACYESEDKLSLKEYLTNSLSEKPGSIAFFIGPEGGFTDYEISLFKNAGISTVSLGPRIMRTELAPAAVLAAIAYATEKGVL